MFTIRATAEMGPWMLAGIDVVSVRERCRRCSKRIKNVWVMVQKADGDAWRIGCDCGPQLEQMSVALWGAVAAPTNKASATK